MYVEEYAQRAIDFIQCLTHVKGRWAKKPFILLDWQVELVSELFGNVDDNGKRIYRKCYVEIPKKNGKSELAAAIALYLLTLDGEIGAEIYSAAVDRKQASIVFRVAAKMVKQSKYLSKKCRVIESQKRIVFYETDSFYEVLSSDVDTKHGFDSHGVIFDELHAQPNRKLWDVLTDGSGIAREQPLIFAITTAGFDRNSICWEIHEYAEKVIKKVIDDKHFLAKIYGLDVNADYKDEKNWYIANPSLGTEDEVKAGTKIINIDRFRDDFNEVKNKPAAINNWRRLRLNQWTSAETKWLPIEKWDDCPSKINFEDLKGQICYAGLDLSATTDLTSLSLVFPGEEKKVLPFFFIPREKMLEKVYTDQAPYDVWEEQKHVIVTEGNVVDYNVIEKTIKEVLELYQVQSIAYDPWNATKLIQDLISDGYAKMIPLNQGYKSLNPPSKYFETLILNKKFNHGGNPVLRWNFDNVMMIMDPAGNIKPDKGKSTQRIDGIVATIMALDGVMRNEDTESMYETEKVKAF